MRVFVNCIGVKCMGNINISDDIISLKGVGEKTATLYRHIGIDNIDELIHYFPRDYIKYESKSDSTDFENGKVFVFEATVLKRPLTKKVRRLSVTSTNLMASGMVVSATWFHMPFLSKMLVVGNQYIFRGKLTSRGDHFHIEQAQIFTKEQYKEYEEKIVPVYSLVKGLSNNSITKNMKTAFGGLDKEDYEDGLFDMHFPENIEVLKKAREKLVFDELLLFVLRLRRLRNNNEKAQNDFGIIEVAQCDRIIEKLPYRLTNAQLRVWNEIKEDMCKEVSMSRLVQGDVGSGKTIIALLASVMCACNGYQAAVMAPTEILAEQHFEFFNNIIKTNNLDINVVLLTGSLSEKSKKQIREKIENKEAQIIIGTHALIQEKVHYNNLALVITDEQHRFGVGQRKSFSDKNKDNSPHILVMSATPIPRTLAIILYGDLSVSIIDEVPAHKLPIKNAVVGENYRSKAYDFIKKEIEKGHQAYIICPLVEESEGLNAKDVIGYTDELSAIFPDTIKIGSLYGKMKPSDKNKVMYDFAKNNINILVSTTVVEVGVNVPNATVMLIENADRFGLAQLHQLRGRIGRGSAQSYCIFMSGSDSQKSMERLEVLKNSNDGFEIAEEDLKQRGPGDFFGVRQSGDMSFKLADIISDANILQRAAIKANEIMDKDPELLLPEHSRLKLLLEKSLSENDVITSI